MSKTVTRRRALTVEMTSGSLWKNILLFSLPLMMTQVLEVLFNLSDVAIAGKYAYNTYIALGAVGSTTTLVSLFTGLLIGAGAGVNVAAARGLGMEDNDNVEKTVHSSFLICLGLGVLVCLVCVFFAEPMLRLLNTKEEFLPGAVLYLKLYAIGLPGMGLYNCGNGILSATGDTKRPLVYLFIAGVLNVVPVADEALSAQMAEDPRVRMVSFTGGPKAGHEVALAAAKTFKRTALELGGKNPLILLKDFDVDEAVQIAGNGAFSNQGQLCMATSRILVEEPLYEEFCEKLAAMAKGLKVGDPTDPEVFIGPLIDEAHCPFVQGQIDDAVAQGARVIAGGSYDGPFFQPTVLRDVRPDMRIFHEESFAPVTSVIPVKDPQEALRLCNDNLFGLSAALLTHDLDLAMELGMKIQAGMVHINDLTYLSATTAPSGGVKESGVGREGGRYSMDDYTELKWLTFQTKGRW